jgi:hypothetical protein
MKLSVPPFLVVVALLLLSAALIFVAVHRDPCSSHLLDFAVPTEDVTNGSVRTSSGEILWEFRSSGTPIQRLDYGHLPQNTIQTFPAAGREPRVIRTGEDIRIYLFSPTSYYVVCVVATAPGKFCGCWYEAGPLKSFDGYARTTSRGSETKGASEERPSGSVNSPVRGASDGTIPSADGSKPAATGHADDARRGNPLFFDGNICAPGNSDPRIALEVRVIEPATPESIRIALRFENRASARVMLARPLMLGTTLMLDFKRDGQSVIREYGIGAGILGIPLKLSPGEDHTMDVDLVKASPWPLETLTPGRYRLRVCYVDDSYGSEGPGTIGIWPKSAVSSEVEFEIQAGHN